MHLLFIHCFNMVKERKDTLITIAIIAGGFLLIYFLKGDRWMLYLALGVALVGGLWPKGGRVIQCLWMKLAWVLGLIVPKILLTAIFFLVLFPLSLLSKVFKRKDTLLLKKNSDSTFVQLERQFTKQNFLNPW